MMRTLTSNGSNCFAAACLLAAVLLFPGRGRAQSIWTPSNSNWQAAGNWSAGTPNASTDTAIFGASGITSVSRGGSLNDLGLLQFTSAAPTYTISGNDMTLYGVSGIGLTNASANTQNIGVSVILGGDQQWQANAGSLVFSQQVSLNGYDLTLSGAGNVTFSAPVYQGTAGTFTKTGSGTTTISGGAFQPFSTIQNGLVLLNTSSGNGFENGLVIGGTASSAEVRLSGNSRLSQFGSVPHIQQNGLLNLNGFSQSLSTMSFTGGTVQTGAGTLTMTAGGVMVTTNASSTSATITGALALTGYQPNFQVANGAAANDLIVNATINASSGFIKSGAGTMRINQAVTTGSSIYNDKIRLSGGTLLLGASNLINNSSPIQFDGGTLGTGGFSDTVGQVTLTANSTIDLGSSSSVLRFAASNGISGEWLAGNMLTISNWSGSLTGGGTDQLFFGSSATGLTAGQIAQIQFLNPAGLSAGTYGAKILSSGEIVPFAVVPEMGATLAGLLLTLVAFGPRRRRATSWVPELPR